MENKEIIITVSGVCGSGKSHITYLINKFLTENGFSVDFDGGLDFNSKYDFIENMSKNFANKDEYIKNTRNIKIIEQQLPLSNNLN